MDTQRIPPFVAIVTSAERSCAAGTFRRVEEGRPPDVRDSLSELERRLLELERELRADALSDAGAARQGPSAARRAPHGEPPVQAEREPLAPRTATGTVEAPAPVASGPGDAAASPTWPPGPAAPAAPDVGPLVEETQRRVDSLRNSLDGLTGASDRLREVAQTVVEDHGRALVRLERATAQQRAQLPPTFDESAPQAPLTDVPVAEAPAVDESRVEEPPSEEPTTPDDVRDAPPPRRRRGWLWLLLGPLLIAAGVITALVLYGDDEQPATPTTTTLPGASARIALALDLGPDAQAFDTVPGTRDASDIGALADLCDGVVGAAVVVRAAADNAPPPCEGLVTVTDGSASALALAERAGRGRRSCVDAADVPTIAASRPDRTLTAARSRAVRRAETTARQRTRGAGLTAAERVGTIHTAAYEAGRRFDAQRRLRLLAVRARPGSACVVPGRDDVASGRYPLADRIELIATEATRALPAVERAAVVIDNMTSGPAPINATVVRRAR